MLVELVVLLTLAAPHKPTVAAGGVSFVNLNDKEGDAYIDFFADRLGRSGRLEVVTRSQIVQLLGLERQRQLMGCPEEGSSCLAELSGALGAEFVLTGSIGKLGSTFTASLKLVNTQTMKAVVSVSERYRSEDGLLDGLAEAARVFVTAVVGPAAEVSATTPAKPLGLRVWVPLVATVLVGAGAGVSWGVSKSNQGLLLTGALDAQGIHAAALTGAQSQTAAMVLSVAAAVGLAATVILWLLPESTKSLVSSALRATGFEVLQ